MCIRDRTYAEDAILVVAALAQSINTLAVRVGEQAGVGNIYRFMKNSLGVTSLTPEDNDSGPMICLLYTSIFTGYPCGDRRRAQRHPAGAAGRVCVPGAAAAGGVPAAPPPEGGTVRWQEAKKLSSP